MSIRLRFTLLYNAILALTLAVFGFALYSVQARVTYGALKQDLVRSSDRLAELILRADIFLSPEFPFLRELPPVGLGSFPSEQVFRELPEREISRILDSSGALIASPFGRSEDVLPLSERGLAAAQSGQDWWESGQFQEQEFLIYTRPVLVNGEVALIVQSARPLTERNRSLQFLASSFTIASLLTILAAFGIGWVFSGITLRPIQRLTQTARAIGEERDFTRRVSHPGPQDEVGQLAVTLNAMLSRLQDAYQQTAHSLEMQRNFVADVSHELRTPLTTLRGNLGLLRRQPPIPTEERDDILADMTDESDRLIRLVNDLLVLARADAGRSLVNESVAVLPVMEEICRQARALDPARDIRLKAEDLLIVGDRDALKQVLLIVLDNAIKHSDGPVEISADRSGKQARISVRDFGPGIPPEMLAHIFDRFYRGETSPNLPGFGLGLAIAKSLVEAMGGEITMESQLDKGSILIIRLPTEKG